jgi:hypothetical protein
MSLQRTLNSSVSCRLGKIIMPTAIKRSADLKPGEIYEDCFCHPCLCTRVDGNEVSGISLIDGSYPRMCSIDACDIRKLTVDEASFWKSNGPPDVELEPKHRWWDKPRPWTAGS